MSRIVKLISENVKRLHAVDIAGGLSAVLATKKRLYPSHVNRISSIDDPCSRKLYYARVNWDKATVPDDGLQGIFETGNVLEPVIERIVSEAGIASNPPWRIVGHQMPTADGLLAQYQISGTIDGLLQVRDGDRWITLGAVDIKTTSPNMFRALQTADDLLRYPHTSRYRGQVMLYSLAHNLERCFLLLVNKQNLYDMRLLEVPLDMAHCESLLAKAKAINEAVAAKTPPAGVNDPDICPKCQFYSFCCPDMVTGGNLTISDSAELEQILERIEELRETKSEIKELEEERDSYLTPGQAVAVGRWLVTWKQDKNKAWRKKIVCAPNRMAAPMTELAATTAS